jgi:uncharacterized protein
MSEPSFVATDCAKPADRPIRGFDTFLAVLAAVGVSLVVGGVLVIAIIALFAALRIPGNPAELLQTDFAWVVGLTTVIDAIILAALWLVAKRFAARPWAYFFPAVPARTLVRAAISAIALAATCLALEAALKYGLHIPLPLAKTEEAMNPKSWSQLAVVLVCFAAIVPFYEEVLFRGYIFGWLKRVTPVWVAILLSAAIFAAVHGLYIARGGVSGWVGTGEIFAIGVLLAWWAARTNSLRPAFVVHLVNNAAAFTLAFLLPGWP